MPAHTAGAQLALLVSTGSLVFVSPLPQLHDWEFANLRCRKTREHYREDAVEECKAVDVDAVPAQRPSCRLQLPTLQTNQEYASDGYRVRGEQGE